MAREKQVNLRLSADEMLRLCAIAAERGLDWSAAIRQLVKEDHDRISRKGRTREAATKRGGGT